MSQSKRKYERKPLKLKSQVSSPETFTFSTARNLSSGGLFISTPEPYSHGTELELSITMPGGEIVTAKGVVRWTKSDDSDNDPSGMGVEFQALTEACTKMIKAVTS